MSANNNSKGILLIITAMTFFAMQDALIKFIFEKAALYEIFFWKIFCCSNFAFWLHKIQKTKSFS